MLVKSRFGGFDEALMIVVSVRLKVKSLPSSPHLSTWSARYVKGCHPGLCRQLQPSTWDPRQNSTRVRTSIPSTNTLIQLLKLHHPTAIPSTLVNSIFHSKIKCSPGPPIIVVRAIALSHPELSILDSHLDRISSDMTDQILPVSTVEISRVHTIS